MQWRIAPFTALWILCLSIAVPPPSAQSKHRAEPSASQYRIPIGTVVSVRLRTPIDSGVSQTNEQIDAELTEPVTQDGVELIPVGSLLHGAITKVEPATRKAPLGQVTFSFAIARHAESGSRAPFPTQAITIHAQLPAVPAGTRRTSRVQPIDVVLPAGHPLRVTLSEPLVVAIPKGR
jgi:hypothetical protein